MLFAFFIVCDLFIKVVVKAFLPVSSELQVILTFLTIAVSTKTVSDIIFSKWKLHKDYLKLPHSNTLSYSIKFQAISS